MKIIFLVLFSALLSTSLIAQEETLFGDLNHSGGYGGPVWKIGQFGDESGMLSGGRGGWIINHTFAIGGGGYNSIIDISTGQKRNNSDLVMKFNYGGFEFEYIKHSDRLIHWTIHTLIGGGSVKLFEEDTDDEIEKDRFFMIEPSINADFNINKWFRVGLGVSYRAALGVDSDFLSDSDLSGLSGLIILKFGSF